MSYKFILPAVFFMSLGVASAQQDPQPQKPADQNAPTTKTQSAMKTGDKPAKTLSGFVDKNNDGIDDRKQGAAGANSANAPGARKRMRMRDAFIDADGDGINDNRCGGMGLQKRACKNGKGCGN